MAKAYLKKGSQSEIQICGRCEQEHSRIDQKEGYRTPDEDLLFEDDYAHYWESRPQVVTLYWCEYHDEWTDTEPETRETDGVWVCGVCGLTYDNEDDAVECER